MDTDVQTAQAHSPVGARVGVSGKRELLHHAIEDCWQDLLVGIQVYIRKFGLSGSPGGDDALARDVLQDAILSALQRPDRYDPTRPARPWLLGFAINGLRHRRRSLSAERQRVIPVAETAEVMVASRGGRVILSEDEMFSLLYPSTTHSRPPSSETLDEMLEPLPEADQVVLKLHFEQDLRGKDLAAALGVHEGQAWARLSRAKTRLREAYRQEQSAGAERRR